MSYTAKNFDHLIGTPGLSDQLLKNHFTLYQGYVTNTNKLTDELGALLKDGKTATPQFAEIQRRFGWEFNGMRLHEIYFGNMNKAGGALDENSELAQQMKKDFGSTETWKKAFRGVGEMRGVGWALLMYDPEGQRLHHTWINEHNVNWLATSQPILLMDVWEHAFMLDYGIKRPAYIDAFMNVIDWKVAANRFRNATKELSVA